MIVTQISIDLSGLSRFEYVIAKQADEKSRVIQVQLLDNGKIYVMDDQTTARVSIKKPDKKEIIEDCTINNNMVEIVLDANMLAVSGTATAEIILTGGNGEALTSASFDIKIIATATGKKAESSTDYKSFKTALAAADVLRKEIAEKATKQELNIERARIDNLSRLEEGSTTGDAELQDIRVGVDGTIYENAGTAVREQVADIDKIKKYIGFGLLVISEKTIKVKEGKNTTFSVCLGYEPENEQKVFINVNSEKVEVDAEELIFTPENYSVEQVITVTGVEDEDEKDEAAEIIITTKVIESCMMIGYAIPVTINENTYTKENLIADYDAVQNTRSGHNANTTVWEDLSGNNYDIDITAKNGVSGSLVSMRDIIYTNTPSNNQELAYYWFDKYLRINIRGLGSLIDVDDISLSEGFSVNMVMRAKQIYGYIGIVELINFDTMTPTDSLYNSCCCVPCNGKEIQGMAGFGGNAKRFALPNIESNQLMLTYTEDINSNYCIYVNGELYSSGTNGKKFNNQTVYDIKWLRFFKNVSTDTSHMSVYSKVLTEEEVKESFEYFDKKYGLANILEVKANITPSGTVYPYTEIPVTTEVIPEDKTENTTIEVKAITDNVEVIE